IIKLLEDKACIKQRIFRKTEDVFLSLKAVLEQLGEDLKRDFNNSENLVNIHYTDKGDYEAQLSFSGDVLVISRHSNVFSFAPEHEINHLDYVQEDPLRKYCGIIHIHNFLSD